MTIPVAGGTYRDILWSQTLGTRAELADKIKDELVAAGWTSSGSASDYQVTSATTPQGLAARVRVYDPGSGSCARLRFSNAAGTKNQTGDHFLLPLAGKSWRFIANQHQFFVINPGSTAARNFVAGGAPWVPSFVGLFDAVWSQSNSISDTDSTTHQSIRSRLCSNDGSASIVAGNSFMLANGTITETNNNASSSLEIGLLTLWTLLPCTWNTTGGTIGFRWFDNSAHATEANIGWGASATSEPKVMGQLWDAVIFSQDFSTDASITYLGRTWRAITANSTGSTSNFPRGSLMVAVN